jgi:hypothetical protein
MRYVLLALLATACIDHGDGSIDYHVIGGFTTPQPPLGLHIEPDGRATQTTRDGTFPLVLAPAMLHQLENAVNEAELPSHVVYTGCCDFPDDQIVVNDRDGTRTLEVNRNAKDVPPARLALVYLLQQLNQ